MINYHMIGVSDLQKASTFYDGVLDAIGAARTHNSERYQFYSQGENKPLFAICIPFNQEDPTAGNGTMTALSAPSKEAVHSAYAKAIELGATCEGEPGPRGNFGEFAYFRDADGNKLCVSCFNK